jgi:putative nucleotidyltransferase with HDIG domain
MSLAALCFVFREGIVMKVLVADDIAFARKLIGRLLRAAGDVDMVEAADGAEALSLVASEQFDLLLLDWDMPQKTGLEVVRELRATGCQVPVLMITATAERDSVVDAVVAGVSDYLVKPFSKEAFREKFERLRAQIGKPKAEPKAEPKPAPKPTLDSIPSRIDDISSLPNCTARIIKLANDPDSTATDMQMAIEADPVLAAKLLRYVNSSATALRTHVSNLQQAVAYLGMKQVRNIALAASVHGLFPHRGGIGPYRRVGLWRHLVAVAVCARLIAKRLDFADYEDVFLAGLMHDIGIILEDEFFHPQFCNLVRSLAPKKTLIDAEREHFDFDHTELGAHVAARWHFPDLIQDAIRHHHDSSKVSAEHHKLPVCYIELANLICSVRGMPSVGINLLKPSEATNTALGLTSEDILTLSRDLDQQCALYEQLFRS